jgi:hypothetical protein
VPVNRLIAFIVKPIVTVVVAFISSFLIRYVPGLDLGDASANIEAITQAIAFVVGGYVTSTGFDKWLEGWIKFEENETIKEVSAQGAVPPPPQGE